MAAVATGGIGQPGLVERRHLDHVDQLDSLHQQLGNTVTAMHNDRHRVVEIDQRDLDLTTVARVDRARAVDNRKPYPRSQSGSRVHQTDHADRDGDRDPGTYQRAVSGRQLDVFGAVEINAGVTMMGPGGQWKPGVETNNRQTGRHGATDYP